MGLTDLAKDAAAAATKYALRKIRNDSFVNALTGIGTSRDKRTGAGYCLEALLTMPELDALYSSNDLVVTIVNSVVDDALREGFELKRKEKPGDKPTDPVKDQEQAEAILARCRELGVREKFHSAAVWGRLFGGGAVIVGVTGGGSLQTELKDEKVRGVEVLIDVDRQDLIPQTWNADGTVEIYTWTQVTAGGVGNGQPRLIHHSRVITFPGAKTTNRARARNQGWDHSVIQRIYSVLLGYDGMWASVDHMFADMSQAVFKLQGFIAAMAEADGEGAETVTTRIQLMDTLRSVARAIVLDAGDETGAGAESFEVVERGALTGVDGILDKKTLRLACAARMPVTRLMGQSPAGMNATGDSDLEIWGNEVQVERRHIIEPRLERIVNMIARELGDQDPEWTIVWPNLRHTTEKEDAELEKLRVDTAIALVTAQVALPEELAVCLEKIAPTLGLGLDVAAREEALNAIGSVTEAVDPSTALNGAQVASMLEIVNSVATKALPRETAVEMLTAAFPISAEEADKILGAVGESFFVDPPAPAPGPFGAKPPAFGK
jgi:phage-related protein (TIGR01555 family)